jgi:hypothetical protein
MASIKTLKHNRLMQKTDFASSIVSATRWPSKDQNRHKASSAKMVGAQKLNGTCWCTSPCLCPTLLFLTIGDSLAIKALTTHTHTHQALQCFQNLQEQQGPTRKSCLGQKCLLPACSRNLLDCIRWRTHIHGEEAGETTCLIFVLVSS